MGGWEAGAQSFMESDVCMLVGSNPLVSMVAAGGPDQFSFVAPVKSMKERRANGKKLIVIDPRRTETAAFADIFVQSKPGRDDGIRPGVVAMSHCWRGTKEKPWEATNALVHADKEVQSINRMPVMTGFEVDIKKTN